MAADIEALLLRRTDAICSAVATVGVLVDLGGQSGLCLLPLTDRVRRAVSGDGMETVPGFYRLSESVAAWARELSHHSPVVYVHVEFFGGNGFHAAIGWYHGEIAWGPRFTSTDPDEDEHFDVIPRFGDLAVNDALRWLGVPRGQANDEFAAVGLDRFRMTTDWEQAGELPLSDGSGQDAEGGS